MKKVEIGAYTLLCLIILFGCTTGRNFTRPTPESFKLGITESKDIVDNYGKPPIEGFKTINGQTVKYIGYHYASAMGKAYFTGHRKDKMIFFNFFENSLVGYEFTSTFDNDSSYFDESQVSKIIEGKTSKSEVIEILGENYSVFLYPLIKEKTNYALNYLYVKHREKFTGGVETYFKTIEVEFNSDDIVTEIRDSIFTKKE